MYSLYGIVLSVSMLSITDYIFCYVSHCSIVYTCMYIVVSILCMYLLYYLYVYMFLYIS